MVERSLLIKYRPHIWEEVVGQDRVVDSFVGALDKAHAFLLTGPSGCGKTTLAQIAAQQLDCQVEDIDAATYTGIDDMRAVAAGLMYRPFGVGGKAIILDECHQLSKAAQTSLLKVIEKPPPWVYWFLCTTEPGKVAAAIKTRCVSYALKPVPPRVLVTLLLDICKAEKIKVHGDIVLLCADEAQGAPRQAIANLVACLEAKSLEDAAELLASAIGSAAAIDLARAIYKGAAWRDVQRLLGKMDGVSAESIRQVVRAYGTKIALSAPELAAGKALKVLDVFATPFNPHDGLTPVLLACARLR